MQTLFWFEFVPRNLSFPFWQMFLGERFQWNLSSDVQCSAVQCGAVRCSAVQCSAVRCGAVRCGAVQCSAVQCSAVQCSARFVRCSAVQCSARFFRVGLFRHILSYLASLSGTLLMRAGLFGHIWHLF